MKKKWIASLLSVSMAFSMFAPMAFAASEEKHQVVSQNQGRMLKMGNDESGKKIHDAVSNQNIIIGKYAFSLDPAAKDVIPREVYAQYVNSVKFNNSHTTNGVITWTMKAIKNAFRIGGWALSPIVKLFDKKMGEAVRKHSAKIADALDTIEKWSEETITRALILVKIPEDVAKAIAKVIMTLL